MDLTLKISRKEDRSMANLLKQMCALKCPVKVDSEEGSLSIIGMDDNNVEKVIDSIDDAFNILAIDIVPSPDLPLSEASSYETYAPEEAFPEEPSTMEKALESPTVRFFHRKVEKDLDRFVRTIHQVIFSDKAPIYEICNYLKCAQKELLLKYKPYESAEFSIGDIVDCNLGIHPKGEVSGAHVHALVCNIDEEKGMVYVIPMAKYLIEDAPFTFKTDVDVTYIDPQYTEGTLLINQGRYIIPGRINGVVGTSTFDFFEVVLDTMAEIFDFSPNVSAFLERIQSDNLSYEASADEAIAEEMSTSIEEETHEEVSDEVPISVAEEVIPPVEDETPEENSGEAPISEEILAEEVSSPTEGETLKEVSGKVPFSGEILEKETITSIDEEPIKKSPSELLLESCIADSFAILDTSKTKPSFLDVTKFVESIDFPLLDGLTVEAFLVACEVKKITFDSITASLSRSFRMKEEAISKRLKEAFKEWLSKYPEVKAEFPKISFMILLRVFAKKYKRV